MSLYVCEECGTVENTALARYWFRNQEGESGRVLCSACDPKIGRWHGHWPREQYDPAKHTVLNPPGEK